jgi:hypothetical protein
MVQWPVFQKNFLPDMSSAVTGLASWAKLCVGETIAIAMAMPTRAVVESTFRLPDFQPPKPIIPILTKGAIPVARVQPNRLSAPFTDSSFRSLFHLAVTRIEISASAYAALAPSATRGLVEPRQSPEGQGTEQSSSFAGTVVLSRNALDRSEHISASVVHSDGVSMW